MHGTLLSLRFCGFLRPATRRPSLWQSLLGRRLIQHQLDDVCGRLRTLGGRSGDGISLVGYGGVDCVVGCDRVRGVVGSWTCCADFLLDTLHLELRTSGKGAAC